MPAENPYSLLLDLLPLIGAYWERYGGKGASMQGFAQWLYREEGVNGTPHDPTVPEHGAETELAILIATLFRYAKSYIKKVLEPTLLSTMDDFSFLATLYSQESFRKTELIQRHILEITSGTEILKRLEKLSFISTFDDPDDKRSKRVAITEGGRAAFEQVWGEMDAVTRLISGELARDEKAQLLHLLQKLAHFHQGIYQEDRKSDLDDILKKYLPGN